jgi:hypothetical protein
VIWLYRKLPFDWARRIVAERQFADFDDWNRKLTVADFNFTPEQRDQIEKLFTPEIEAEYAKTIKRAWYKAARAALPSAIEGRRRYLEIKNESTSPQTD